jgi:hypothetical protein
MALWEECDTKMGDHLEGQLAHLVSGRLAQDFTLPQSARVVPHSLHGRPIVLVFYSLDWEPVSGEQFILY